MPIEYKIDPASRIVTVSPRGTLTFQEMKQYQQEVWTRSDVAGYSELVDMNGVTEVLGDTIDNVKQLAELSCAMDPSIGPTRLAIVASTVLHYGMGKMYKLFREADPGCTKEVQVFRASDDAFRWLSAQGRTDADKVGPR